MLSDVVAEEVVRLRAEAKLSRQDLADRCAELGFPQLTAAVLNNIETGRRGPDGARRREVTVDELIVLATALRIAPVLLVFPVGRRAESEVLPGSKWDTWSAAEWFTGADATSGIYAPASDANDPLRMYRRHSRLVSDHQADVKAIANYRRVQTEQDSSLLAMTEGRALSLEKDLRTLRWDIARAGFLLPVLPPYLIHIDDDPSFGRYLEDGAP